MKPAIAKELLLKYDNDDSKIKLALYAGHIENLTVQRGCVSVGTSTYYVSSNLIDGSIISCNIIAAQNQGQYPSLLLRDISQYGTQDLTSITFRFRLELLELFTIPFPSEYGFALFGARCIAPRVYIAIPMTFSLLYAATDPRLIGVTLVESRSLNVSEDVFKVEIDKMHHGVDSVNRWPPIPNEAAKVLVYKNYIQSAIRKMSGKWRDVYLKKHSPGLLPFDAEDLMQQGLMEVTIALRKFDTMHISKAQELTFVYRHLWHRFGQIAHKYSKSSKGYGALMIRDFINEDGQLIPSYDIDQNKDNDNG